MKNNLYDIFHCCNIQRTPPLWKLLSSRSSVTLSIVKSNGKFLDFTFLNCRALDMIFLLPEILFPLGFQNIVYSQFFLPRSWLLLSASLLCHLLLLISDCWFALRDQSLSLLFFHLYYISKLFHLPQVLNIVFMSLALKCINQLQNLPQFETPRSKLPI